MTDTTPAALGRIIERLNTEMAWPQTAMGVEVLAIPHPLCREAAAVIAALQGERDAVDKDRESWKAAHYLLNVQLTDAETRLRDVRVRAAGICEQHHANADEHAARYAYALALHDISTIARTVGEKDNG